MESKTMGVAALSEHTARLEDKLRFELGESILGFLDDPNVIEIILNPNGQLWVERLGEALEPAGTLSPQQAESLIATLAFAHHQVVNRDNPILECELPLDGSRFHGVLPPVVSAPCFSIRKRALHVFTLEDYERQGALNKHQKKALIQAIKARKNILVVGGTGSGKTTFANALIAQIQHQHPEHRLLILEDLPELQCNDPKSLLKRTCPTVSMRDLLRSSLRLRPDRILVGEVRDGAALDMLKAWNTGHPGGIATIHANSAAEGLNRLEQLILEATPSPMNALIAQAVDVVVYMEKSPTIKGGRTIQGLLQVDGLNEAHDYCITPLETAS